MDESIVKHLEQPQVGTLKLSEAMRIGARLRPQCSGYLFNNGASCALGAAYEAVYGYPPLRHHKGDFASKDARFSGRELGTGLREYFVVYASGALSEEIWTR